MANDINSVIFTGRLCRDVEVRTTANGHKVASARVAINESVKRGAEWQEKTAFVDVTAWSHQADKLEGKGKGDAVTISGRLDMEEWKDKTTGEKRSKLKVTADRIICHEVVAKLKDAEGQRDPFEDVPANNSDDERLLF